MRRDIGGILGVNRNRSGLESSGRKDIEWEVANLLHNKHPFTKPIGANNNSGHSTTGSGYNHEDSHSCSHNHNHSHRHGHNHHRHGHNHRRRRH
jgi:hypothetical protein